MSIELELWHLMLKHHFDAKALFVELEQKRVRTTVNLEEDAYLAATQHAKRLGISLGAAISRMIREARAQPVATQLTPRGRFALLPVRDELITVEHVRELMEREGI